MVIPCKKYIKKLKRNFRNDFRIKLEKNFDCTAGELVKKFWNKKC